MFVQTIHAELRCAQYDKDFRIIDWMLRQYQTVTYPRSVTYMPKTKRPRKVHFVWADTNDVKCEVRQDGNTLYSKWAPDVTCAICRQMMVNRGVTRIL